MVVNKRDVRRRLDERLALIKAADFTPPPKGWLRAIRDALAMSGTQFAARLGIAWQSMDDLEKSEAAGTIQLATLRRAALALDCRLVYALVPNTSLEQSVNDRARRIALRDLARVSQTMALEDQQVSDRPTEEQVEAYIRDHVRDRDIWDEK
jgi:predicted DNA-binding mobile mystery protein A